MALSDLRTQAVRRTPEELIQHLNTFQLQPKFSAGVWYFSPPRSRFHEEYQPNRSVEERLEIASCLKGYGLDGIEAHYPNEINESNIDIWKTFERDTGIKLITIIPLLFWDKQFEWGSLSNPSALVRRAAIERTKQTLELNQTFDTEFAIIWPGIDGYEDPFGIDFPAMRDRFIDGLAEAMDSVPGVRIAFEPKPYEPRGHILFGSTAEGMLLCRLVEDRLRQASNQSLLSKGHALCCMNPEIGHVAMAYEDLPYAYSWPLSEGRLAHVHCNSQPLGNYDQDLNVGSVGIEQFEAFLYVLKMHGYQGWFGIDINPERMPVETALRINMDSIRAANDRINSLDHESIICSVSDPDSSRGWLEAYLLRTRACDPKTLSPLRPFSQSVHPSKK
jgi:xylose isomerase